MNYPHHQWRLLITPPSSGAWNMAVDEALLESVGQDRFLPCLRLYTWKPPCLSIGYAQPSTDIDQQRLAALGWQYVRRPTGGRAILHTDELTYSVIAPLNEPRVKGSLLESYQRLSRALLTTLHDLGIPAIANPVSADPHRNEPVCFEVPSNYEIVVNGKKLVGSAQARRKQAVLQHGSLPLEGDLTRITQALVYPDDQARDEAAVRLLAHATTVENVLGHKLGLQAVIQAFIDGFQTELNLEFLQGELQIEEIELIERLVRQKYSHASWLNRL